MYSKFKIITNLLEEKRLLHVNDPKIYYYWDKSIEILSENYENCQSILNMLNENELYHIGEIVDDLSYIFQSIEFIELLEELDKKYPKAQLSKDIKNAKKILYEGKL